MAKYLLNLQIEPKQNARLTQKQIKRIEDFLNAHFLDAAFELTEACPELRLNQGKLERNAITARLSDWEENTIKELLEATEPVKKTQPTDRVKIHRLRAKLPDKYQIQSKRKGGYTLVKV